MQTSLSTNTGVLAEKLTTPEIIRAYSAIEKHTNEANVIQYADRTFKKLSGTIKPKGVLLYMVAAALANFQNYLNVGKKLNLTGLLEVAELLIDKYRYETFGDIVLALKWVKQSGRNFYDKVSGNDFFEIMEDYLYWKSEQLENEEKKKVTKSAAESIERVKVIEYYDKLAKGQCTPLKTANEILKEQRREEERKAAEAYRLQLLNSSGEKDNRETWKIAADVAKSYEQFEQFIP